MKWIRTKHAELEKMLVHLDRMHQKANHISHLLPMNFPAEILLLQLKIRELIKRLP